MYYLGIDGGGTKTKAIVSTEQGLIIGIGYGGPSSIRSVSNEDTKDSIYIAIEEAMNGKRLPLTSVFVGLGDIESLEDEKLVEGIIRDIEYISDSTLVKVESDIYSALYAGLGILKEGVSVIIGTGSVAFGKKDKLTNRVGGYSYKEGDPGSSFFLGRLCLWHVSKMLDCRRNITSFGNELMELLNVSDRVSYVEVLDEYYLNRTKTAQLAKLVTTYAACGDEYALEIMNEGVKGIVEIIDTCSNQLELEEKNIAVIGSLGNHSLYMQRITEELHNIDPKYNVFKTLLDPSLGAVIGALHNDGISITEYVIDTLKRQKT